MAVENAELMHEFFLKHLRMGTARMKEDKETEEGKQKRVIMERSSYSKNELILPQQWSTVTTRIGFDKAIAGVG